MENPLTYFLNLENQQHGLGTLFFNRHLPCLTQEENKFFHDLIHKENQLLASLSLKVLRNELREYMLLTQPSYFRDLYCRCLEANSPKYLHPQPYETDLTYFIDQKIVPHVDTLRSSFLRILRTLREEIETVVRDLCYVHVASDDKNFAFFHEFNQLLATKGYMVIKGLLVDMFEKDIRLFVNRGVTDSGDYDALLVTNRATLWTGVLVI